MDIPQACNIAQFNFSLGGGSDTVGYQNETARIVAIVTSRPACFFRPTCCS